MAAPKSYLYYPGCSLEGAANPYDTSARAMMKALGSPLKELDDWNCCGATTYFSVRELQAFALSARNLALAEQQGGSDLIVACNACFAILGKTAHYLAEKPNMKKQVNEALGEAGLHYYGKVNVRHLVDVVISDIGADQIAPKITKKLAGLKLAPYYGCLFSRPGGYADHPENPVKLDKLLATTGAQVVDWEAKTACCGGMVLQTDEKVAVRLMDSIVLEAERSGAEVLVTACPLCHVNLELAMSKVEKKRGKKFNLSVMFFTQILGLALGLSMKELGVNQMLTMTQATLKKLAA